MPDQPKDKPLIEDLTPTLVAGIRQGDPDAGILLDELYRKKLIRFCLGYLGSQDEAEDVVQDVFFQVLKSQAIPSNFRAWIYRICRNRCLNVQRARGRRRDDKDLPTASRLDADLTGRLTHLVRNEQLSRLHYLIASLPSNQREVINLRYGEDLSRTEIAEVLDVTESLVKSRLYEGLVNLRKHTSLVQDI